MTICILGRQSRLSLAELESLHGAEAITPLGREAALLEASPDDICHDHLGGTIKVAKLITTLSTTNWQTVQQYCLKHLPAHLDHLPEGKLKLGLSVHGLATSVQNVHRTGLELKKAIRAHGRSVRIIPNTALTLSSAQVLHNKLTDELGIELLFVAHRGKTYIGQTVSVQDVESYARRDFGRPKRDAFVGMLPPKLAQIMLNLAHPRPGSTVLDPFCGTGVVLLEAALRGFAVEGSDLNQKMVDYTRANLQWLTDTYHLSPHILGLSLGDATSHEWRKPVGAVVTETYLGQPLSGLPSSQKLHSIIQNCDVIVRKFLQNLHHQLPPGTRCTIAVPAWRVQNRFLHLPLVDDLEKMGYNRVSFSHATTADLLYHRPDQVVARELFVLIRK